MKTDNSRGQNARNEERDSQGRFTSSQEQGNRSQSGRSNNGKNEERDSQGRFTSSGKQGHHSKNSLRPQDEGSQNVKNQSWDKTSSAKRNYSDDSSSSRGQRGQNSRNENRDSQGRFTSDEE